MAKLVKEDVIAGLKEMNMVEIMDLVKAQSRQTDQCLHMRLPEPHPHHAAHHPAAARLIQFVRLLQRRRFYIIINRNHSCSPF